jgi:hypothetical protein
MMMRFNSIWTGTAASLSAGPAEQEKPEKPQWGPPRREFQFRTAEYGF